MHQEKIISDKQLKPLFMGLRIVSQKLLVLLLASFHFFATFVTRNKICYV